MARFTERVGADTTTKRRTVRSGEETMARASTRPYRATPEERQRMIAEAAYYRAERRGFVAGDPMRDWLEAEAEIDAKLGLH